MLKKRLRRYGMKLRQDKRYPSMYWVVWDDGVESADFYSKSRANDHMNVLSGNVAKAERMGRLPQLWIK